MSRYVRARCTSSTRARRSTGPPVERAVEWLVHTQRGDGSWDEPYYTGTGFPGDFYLNYHLYRQVFPVMALGRLLAGADD
jgi:squalene-hopene/tetraprenyl-beta-curcumene cyclase